MIPPILHELRAFLVEHSDEQPSLLSILEQVQARHRYLPRDVLILISERLDIPLSQVYSVATFYNSFSLKPQGRHKFQVCTGTACHVRGAAQVLDRMEVQLGLLAGQTSADLEHTLETVNCLGACAFGPVLIADGEYTRQMTVSKVDRLLKRMR
jgi:NADH-quinone oxidoreductase subunit E